MKVRIHTAAMAAPYIDVEMSEEIWAKCDEALTKNQHFQDIIMPNMMLCGHFIIGIERLDTEKWVK